MTGDTQQKFAVREFFDRRLGKVARKQLSFFDSFFFEYYSSFVGHAVARLASIPSVHLLLDFGCGDGKFSFLSARQRDDIHTVGIDISRHSLRLAQQSIRFVGVKKRVSWVLCDVEKLPFRHDTFDAVQIVNVIHHLSSFQPLEGLREVLKKRAYLLIIDLVSTNPLVFLSRKIWRLIPIYVKRSLRNEGDLVGSKGEIPHKLWFTSGMLFDYLASAGFELFKKERKHLFIFSVYYANKIFPLAHYLFPTPILYSLYRFEQVLLSQKPFRKLCHVVVCWCIRK